MTTTKPVYMYDVDMNFIQKFETTKECAEFFHKSSEYINYNLKNYKKIRKGIRWYIIKREFAKKEN